jgi:hypothetical protein
MDITHGSQWGASLSQPHHNRPWPCQKRKPCEQQPHGRNGDDTRREGFQALAFRSLWLKRAPLPMVLMVEKAFNCRYSLCWIRHVSVSP